MRSRDSKTGLPDLVPVSEILPAVLARIPGMGAYLRRLEEEKTSAETSVIKEPAA